MFYKHPKEVNIGEGTLDLQKLEYKIHFFKNASANVNLYIFAQKMTDEGPSGVADFMLYNLSTIQEELNGTPEEPIAFPEPMVFSWWDFEHPDVYLMAVRKDIANPFDLQFQF